ncbi:MAG: hypothetical protein FWG72_10345 [Oscillospiraceae bacterium]|nr:hypothetical protein [Oscillospiraceae bacterium]
MPEEPIKKHAGQAVNPDEIDAFLASLPSLHIPDDMIEDPDDIRPVPKKKPVDITSVFSFIAWCFLIFSLLTLLRAYPSRGNFFHAYTDTVRHASVNMQYIMNATIYLSGNCLVCAGGLAICALQKRKLSRGNALSFWIAGCASAVIAAILLIS